MTSRLSRLPVFLIAHRDRKPPKKLLQFGLQIGSPKDVQSLAKRPQGFRQVIRPFAQAGVALV
jgi:hypothetical protein